MDKENKILLVGYREAMVAACKRLGIRFVNIVDAWDEPETLPPCKEGNSRLITNNNTFDENVMSALARSGEIGFDAVCTTDEFFVVLTSLLGNTLSTPFLEPMVAVAFRDKYYQKQLLKGTVPVADSWFIDDVRTNQVTDSFSYPLIFKPTAGAGAAYTYKVSDFHELKDIIEMHKKSKSLPKSMLIEEYIPGEEWHLDGWIYDEKIQLLTVSKYGKPIIEIKDGWVANSITLRPELYKNTYSRMYTFVKKVLSKLGLKDGVFHIEGFYNKETDIFTFSEAAARVAGYTPESIENMFGVELHEVLLRLVLGEEVTCEEIRTEHFTGWTLIPYLDNNQSYLPERSQLLSLPGVVKVQYNWVPGQPIPNTKEASTESLGLALIKGDSEDQLKGRIQNFIDNFEILSNNYCD